MTIFPELEFEEVGGVFEDALGAALPLSVCSGLFFDVEQWLGESSPVGKQVVVRPTFFEFFVGSFGFFSLFLFLFFVSSFLVFLTLLVIFPFWVMNWVVVLCLFVYLVIWSAVGAFLWGSWVSSRLFFGCF